MGHALVTRYGQCAGISWKLIARKHSKNTERHKQGETRAKQARFCRNDLSQHSNKLERREENRAKVNLSPYSTQATVSLCRSRPAKYSVNDDIFDNIRAETCIVESYCQKSKKSIYV